MFSSQFPDGLVLYFTSATANYGDDFHPVGACGALRIAARKGNLVAGNADALEQLRPGRL